MNLALSDEQVASVQAEVQTFALPPLSAWQRVVLDRALRFVGSPYVWAGTSEKPQQLFGRELPGGFDCSGFVWRVYKTKPFAGAPGLNRVLVGRTTYAMSGEVLPSHRVSRDALAPGARVLIVDDVLATGGTLAATTRLVAQADGQVHAIAVVMELGFLPGRETVGDVPLTSLLTV